MGDNADTDVQMDLIDFVEYVCNKQQSLRWWLTRISLLKQKPDHKVISIHVGAAENPDRYNVSKDVLIGYGRYFRTALSSKFLEGQTGVLRFPEDDRTAWLVILYHMWVRCIPQWTGDSKIGFENYILGLAHAYELGDKYGLGRLQNNIMDYMVLENDRDGFHAGLLIDIVRATSTDSLMRGFALREIIYQVMVQEWFDWSAFEELSTVEKGFVNILTELELFHNEPKKYPPHRHNLETHAARDQYYVEE